MDIRKYDIIKANIKYEGSGSVQTKEPPYVVVSNPVGTKHGTIITVMPLTSKIKKENMPVHGCIKANNINGLSLYSMILGEQPITISKDEVEEKLGMVTNQKEKNMINKICYNTFFFGENINWEEVLA